MLEKQLSGFLLIDKPAGISSFDVIRQLRRQTGIRTFGHAGTLDPFATGLLIIAVNKYTRLLSLLDNAEKEYIAKLILGRTTSTGDPEGEVTSTSDIEINTDKLAGIQQEILKIKTLKPPKYSAIKIDGERSYVRARKDEDFDLPERESHVYSFSIIEYSYPQLVYRCKVSKGTYIRSLSQWIATYLGSVGYTAELQRIAIDEINLLKAVQLDAVTAETIPKLMVSVLDVLHNVETITLNEAELLRIRNGNCTDNAGNDNELVLIFDECKDCRGISFRRDDKLFPKVNL